MPHFTLFLAAQALLPLLGSTSNVQTSNCTDLNCPDYQTFGTICRIQGDYLINVRAAPQVITLPSSDVALSWTVASAGDRGSQSGGKNVYSRTRQYYLGAPPGFNLTKETDTLGCALLLSNRNRTYEIPHVPANMEDLKGSSCGPVFGGGCEDVLFERVKSLAVSREGDGEDVVADSKALCEKLSKQMNDENFVSGIGERCLSKLSAQETRFDAVPILGDRVSPPVPEGTQVDAATDINGKNSTNCHPTEPKGYQMVEVYGLFQEETIQGETVKQRKGELQNLTTGYSPIITVLYGGDTDPVLDMSCLIGDADYVSNTALSLSLPHRAYTLFVAALIILSA